MGVGPLFPKQKVVLLTSAQQGHNAAYMWLTQVCSEEGLILWLQKRPEAHLATSKKNDISEIVMLWSNFAIALK